MECDYCDRKFKYKKSFTHHKLEVHGMLDEDVPLSMLIADMDEKSEEAGQDNLKSGIKKLFT